MGVRRERLASLPGEGAAVTRRSGAALAARSSRRAEVQRSVHAGVSLQYYRMSPQAVPPSGIIRLCCRRIPHIQHETTTGRRAAKPPAEGARSSSAMTGSPPGDRRDPGLGLEDEQRPARSRSWLDNRWHANPRLASSSDDPDRRSARCAPTAESTEPQRLIERGRRRWRVALSGRGRLHCRARPRWQWAPRGRRRRMAGPGPLIEKREWRIRLR